MSDKLLLVSSDKVLNAFLKKIIYNSLPGCELTVYDRFTLTKQENAFGYKLIIVDEVIIGSSGFEIINHLRYVEKNISKIIFLCDAESEIQRSITLGANFGFLKPITTEKFIEVVKANVK